MRSSNLSQGIRESIRFRNTSRRVCRFLCWYSKSAKVGCSVMVAPPWCWLASVCHNYSIIQSFPKAYAYKAALPWMERFGFLAALGMTYTYNGALGQLRKGLLSLNGLLLNGVQARTTHAKLVLVKAGRGVAPLPLTPVSSTGQAMSGREGEFQPALALPTRVENTRTALVLRLSSRRRVGAPWKVW